VGVPIQSEIEGDSKLCFSEDTLTQKRELLEGYFGHFRDLEGLWFL